MVFYGFYGFYIIIIILLFNLFCRNSDKGTVKLNEPVLILIKNIFL